MIDFIINKLFAPVVIATRLPTWLNLFASIAPRLRMAFLDNAESSSERLNPVSIRRPAPDERRLRTLGDLGAIRPWYVRVGGGRRVRAGVGAGQR